MQNEQALTRLAEGLSRVEGRIIVVTSDAADAKELHLSVSDPISILRGAPL